MPRVQGRTAADRKALLQQGAAVRFAAEGEPLPELPD